MRYRHAIETCFSAALGPRGLEKSEYEAALNDTAPALEAIRRRHADGSLPLLRLPERRDDLAELAPLAERCRAELDAVVVLGTGGSSLGGQTLYTLADQGFGPPPGCPRLLFMDNVDPHTFDVLLRRLDPARTGWLAISKSGGTAETLTQFLIVVDHLRTRVGPDAPGRLVTVITEPTDNPLRRLAGKHGMTVLEHDPGVGGRFSVLSLVGLLPAMIAGLDAGAVRAGAWSVLEPILKGQSPQDCEPAKGAALGVTLARRRGIHTTVLMPYIDRLGYFGLWFRQLWAESLGKNGNGTTPIRAMGTVDQHSQLQLYLDGPADKMFSLVTLDVAGTGPMVKRDLIEDERLAYLAGHPMGDLLDAEQRATARTLVLHGRPTRLFELERLDEATMGALMMHFMLETMIAADLLGVNAFDQPAVEEGKILARQYLGEMKAS